MFGRCAFLISRDLTVLFMRLFVYRDFLHTVIFKKLVTVVKDNQKAPFSIATTRGAGGRYSFPWIAPLYPRYVPYIAERQTRGHHVPFLKSIGEHSIHLEKGPVLAKWVECSPVVRKTWVLSQVTSYQRL